MKDIFSAGYVSLHVRKTNRAALALYRDTLGFEVVGIERAYCESQPCFGKRDGPGLNAKMVWRGQIWTGRMRML